MDPDNPREPIAVAKRIAAQLAKRLVAHDASGDAFVVSVYGEWGIGKTRCLNDVHAVFEDKLKARIQALDSLAVDQWVIPVLFDPWQYEHEAHLIVPLLKTIEQRLDEVRVRVEERVASLGDVPGPVLERAKALRPILADAGGVLGDVAVALLSSFKFGFAPLKEIIGVEVSLEPKSAFESARRADELRAAKRRATPPRSGTSMWSKLTGAFRTRQWALSTWAANRESFYFDVRGQLAALTTLPDMPLRFVILIDDLDRCLPEKAIQVLESVKLFLNAPGFSFVMAVDDEVVERGIAHRYQPYLGGSTVAAPISGAEYLEKIVHLPVHLQRWTAEEAKSFLRTRYKALFDPAAEAGAAPAAPVSRGRQPDDLLELVIAAVPLVPRKLIRLAEATAFMLEQFGEVHSMDCWHPLHAARLVALQQLYPALYRHLRLRPARYFRLFDLTRDEFGEPTFTEGRRGLHELRAEFETRVRPGDAKTATASAGAPAEPAPAPTSDIDTLREQLDLLTLVHAAGQQRGSPDPLHLFKSTDRAADRDPRTIHPLLAGYIEFAMLYIHGLRPPEPRAPSPPAAAGKIAVVPDTDRLYSVLMWGDTVTRREYLQATPLDGRLPDDVFEELMTRLLEVPQRAADIEWLRDVGTLLGPEQLLALYRRHGVIDALWAASEKGSA